MELHQLRYALAVARFGNFSRAAEHCHVAQPSLSQQILKLEEELGERLFNRLKRGIQITPPGEFFLRRAQKILDEVESAKREFQDIQTTPTGTLNIGVIPTIAPYLLPKPLLTFKEKFPSVEISIQEDFHEIIIKNLLAGDLDISLTSDIIPNEHLASIELFTEELLVALSPRHPLAKKKTISLKDLKNEFMILLQDEHCLSGQVSSFCDNHRWKSNIRFKGCQLETIQSLVYSGQGFSLIPHMAIASKSTLHPIYIPLQGDKPKRKILLSWAKHRFKNRAISEFISILST